MPAGLGGAGAVGWAFETTKGTFAAPTVWIPILSESLAYTEDRYYSPQIRQTTIVSDVRQGYYHVEGDIELEVDPNNFIYPMYCTRHTIAKTGAGPYVYTYRPSDAGATSTASGTTTPKTATICVLRNGAWWAYTGCTLGGFEIRIEDAVMKATLNVLGEGEETPGSQTPVWVDPLLYGADSHAVYVAASATAPTFAAASTDFNGFTFRANFNAEAQNRLVTNRKASYVSYGESEIEVETELDFIDKTEYNNFVSTTQKAMKLESTRAGAAFAAATDGVKVQLNRAVYETYDIPLSGMGDLIMAGVTARNIGIAGGSAYQIEVKSAVSIT